MNQSLIFPLLIVLLAVPLFFSYRKQKKTAAAQQNLQKSIDVGDRVMTTSGLYGTVSATGDTSIDLEIAPGLVTTWLRQAVREKVDPNAETTDNTSNEATDTVEDAEPSQESGAQVAPALEHDKTSH